MRIFVFTDPAEMDLGPTNVLVLGVRRPVTLDPAAGGPIAVELEAMAEVREGEALMLVAHPRAVLELGLRPSLPVVMRNHQDELAPLVLWFDPPPVPVTLEPGEPVGEAWAIDLPLRRFYHDLTLPDRVGPVFRPVVADRPA